MKRSIRYRPRRLPRGMTLIETILAMSITAMVGGAITTMMAAVTDEVSAQHHDRSELIRSGLAQSRLSSYIARSHCILELEDDSLVLWLEDSRDGGTVHASEVRWISFDSEAATVEVSFVCFPESWSEASGLVADTEFSGARNVDWRGVLESFRNRDLVCSIPLVEDVSSVVFSGNAADCFDMTLVQSDLDYSLADPSAQTRTAEAIRIHRYPDGVQ